MNWSDKIQNDNTEVGDFIVCWNSRGVKYLSNGQIYKLKEKQKNNRDYLNKQPRLIKVKLEGIGDGKNGNSRWLNSNRFRILNDQEKRDIRISGLLNQNVKFNIFKREFDSFSDNEKIKYVVERLIYYKNKHKEYSFLSITDIFMNKNDVDITREEFDEIINKPLLIKDII